MNTIQTLLIDTNTECLICSSIHIIANIFFREYIFSYNVGLEAPFQDKELKCTDESGISSMKTHSVCPSHTDRSDERWQGCLAGQDREPRSTVFGAVSRSGCYTAMLTKLPMHSRGKKEKPQPSACEKDDKDLPKPQCNLFSELYKQYVMQTGYIKSSSTVWWKQNLVPHGQCRELTLFHWLQSLGTSTTYIRSRSTQTVSLPLAWDAHGSLPSLTSICRCEKIHFVAIILMVRTKLNCRSNNKEIKRRSIWTTTLHQFMCFYVSLCLSAWKPYTTIDFLAIRMRV